jgi:hypothetical protein
MIRHPALFEESFRGACRLRILQTENLDVHYRLAAYWL